MLLHIYLTNRNNIPLTLTLLKGTDYSDDSTIGEIKHTIHTLLSKRYVFDVQNVHISYNDVTLHNSMTFKDIGSDDMSLFECGIINSTRNLTGMDNKDMDEEKVDHYECVKINIGNVECNARLRNGLKPTFHDLSILNTHILSGSIHEIDSKWIII